MAGKVINFPSSFQRSCGYFVVPSEIITEFFKYVRGIGPDSFVVKSYDFGNGGANFASYEIMRGGMPDSKDVNEIKTVRRNQFFAEALLESHASNAYRYIQERRVYQVHDANACAVYIKCNRGMIGCGWYDFNCTNGKKGMLLAALMLYAFASINGKTDEELLKSAYSFLPYGSEMTATDAEKISNIIVEFLTKQVIDRPSPIGRFGRPVN